MYIYITLTFLGKICMIYFTNAILVTLSNGINATNKKAAGNIFSKKYF